MPASPPPQLLKHNGIAIGPILFVVAILAVLVGAISSGSGGFGSSTSTERAKTLATQIINQAQQVKNAVDRVRANGCEDTEISFENGIDTDYTNTNAPLASKPWCHVFQPQGGGIVWQKPPPNSSSYDYIYAGSVCVADVGTGAGTSCWNNGTVTDSEIIVSLRGIDGSLCAAINNTLENKYKGASVPTLTGGTTPSTTTDKFNGDFARYGGTNSRHIHTSFAGALSGCFYNTSSEYVFYFTLVVR